MAEPEVLSQFSDNKFSSPPPEQQQIKLPRIQPPPSRSQVHSKAQSRKMPTLPPLKPSSSSPADPPDTLPLPTLSDPERNDFALEIEQKLKLVMENVNHGQIQEGSDRQSEIEFEQLVEQNRQKIKQQKYKNQSRPNADLRQDRKQSKPKSKTIIRSGPKNDNSLYEKRMKEYRDASSENKYLLKKKQILAQRQQAIEKAVEKAKAVRQQRESPGSRQNNKQTVEEIRQSNKQSLNYPQNYHIQASKPSSHQLPPRSAFKQKLSSKNILKEEQHMPKQFHQQSKTANLFDNIHNLLQNPLKNRAASEMKKVPASNIKMLQEKIKVINQKLGINEINQVRLSARDIQQKTVLDWKRMEYNRGGNLRCYFDSNFEKELDKVGSLQERNTDYLTQLVNHQKTLVELALMKKVRPNISHNTN